MTDHMTDEFIAKWTAAKVHLVVLTDKGEQRMMEMYDPNDPDNTLENVYEVCGFNPRCGMMWVSLTGDTDYTGYNADFLLMLSDADTDTWHVQLEEPRSYIGMALVKLEMVL